MEGHTKSIYCPCSENHTAGRDYGLGRGCCRCGDQRRPPGVLIFPLGPDWQVRASQAQLWAKSRLGRTRSAKPKARGELGKVEG